MEEVGYDERRGTPIYFMSMSTFLWMALFGKKRIADL